MWLIIRKTSSLLCFQLLKLNPHRYFWFMAISCPFALVNILDLVLLLFLSSLSHFILYQRLFTEIVIDLWALHICCKSPFFAGFVSHQRLVLGAWFDYFCTDSKALRLIMCWIELKFWSFMKIMMNLFRYLAWWPIFVGW